MKELNKKELMRVNGGGFGFGFGLLIGAGITLIAGIIDGFVRPLKCN